jgi:hypothetical protein
MLMSHRHQRRIEPGDVIFALFLVAYGVVSISRIPFDFTDLCYLFSLEQGHWVPQEWVHPIYVPTLGLLRGVLGLFGYQGHMLVPVEFLNVVVSTMAFILLYRLARRFPGSSLAAAAALGVSAMCTGFWSATVRPTPYALALLCQTISLSLLISDKPVSPRRYGLAGAMAALSMGFHASAMALGAVGVVCAVFEPDPARTARAICVRVLSFGGAMLAVALACWATFLLYHRIGADYFRQQDFWTTFLTIEQVPHTSVYTSGSAAAQLATFAESLRYQAGALIAVAVVIFVLAAVRRLRTHMPLAPLESRLAIVTAANFAAIGGFFLINNAHNGFIFASLTLVPVLLAVVIRGSWIGLAILVFVAWPRTYENVVRIVRSGEYGANDPQLAEVRFLQELLGPRDVLLTPGAPFPEMLYLAHLNILEVSAGGSSHGDFEVPVVYPGAVLRARIAWWLAHGGRVYYALGDESTDFTGDVSGAEKERQIFWRPESVARERAAKLRELRTALEASGLDVGGGRRSPQGKSYAEIQLRESPVPLSPTPASALPLAPAELRALFLQRDGDNTALHLAGHAQFLAAFEAAVPGDPWLACDVMNLVCLGQPQVAGKAGPCRPLPGCDQPVEVGDDEHDREEAHDDGHARASGSCFWTAVPDRQVIDAYVGEWLRKYPLGQLSALSLQVNQGSAEMTMAFSKGTLVLSWQLLDTCAPGPVNVRPSDGMPADAISPAQLQELVAGLPVPKVRPNVGSRHR